jgi:hypothetical protein
MPQPANTPEPGKRPWRWLDLCLSALWKKFSWAQWLRDLLAKVGTRRGNSIFRQFKPELEVLEERRVPSITAVVDIATTLENSSILLAPAWNDSIIPGDSFSISAGTVTPHGTLSVSGDTLTYTPNTGFIGVDSFTYTDTDNTSPSTSSAVDTIHVISTSSSGVAAAMGRKGSRSVARNSSVSRRR